MQFIHHTGKKKKVYEITSGGLSLTTTAKNGLSSDSSWPFENIRKEKFFHVQKMSGFLVAGGVLLLIYGLVLAESLQHKNNTYIIASGWGLAGLACLVLFFVYRPKLYFIKTHSGGYIKFPASKQLKELNEFVNELYKQQFSNFDILQKEGILPLQPELIIFFPVSPSPFHRSPLY